MITKSAFSLLLLAMTASFAIGQVETTDSAQIHFEEVLSAQSMMHRKTVDKFGVDTGIVDDVVLDVHNGRVAFLIIKRGETAADHTDSRATAIDRFLVVPSVIQEWRGDQPLKLSVLMNRVQESSTAMVQKPLTSFSELELAAIYKFYEADLYWKSSGAVEASPLLLSADEVDGKLIRDSDRMKFGRIEEVLLSPEKKWSIAFLALSQFKDHQSGQDRIAVPLSAFARKRSGTTWLLDISAEAELPGKRFTVGKWPKMVDAGWKEFTHVKYGASAEGGIQILDDQN